MALKDVVVKVKDGGLGVSVERGQGVHVKIGVSTATKNKILALTSSADVAAIKEKLGVSPLSDAVMDSFQMGSSLIYCIPTEGTIEGIVGELKKTMQGQSEVSVIGSPNSDYEVVFEVIKSGAFNDATYKYSLDGGDNFTKEMTVPIDGEISLDSTGLTLKFTEAVVTEDSLKAGDRISFRADAPKMSNLEVLEAINVIKNSTLDFEYIHVVGESDTPLWAALAAEADTLFSQFHKPVFFVCEAKKKAENESLDDYVQGLIEARGTVSSYRIQVVPARAEIAALDGRIKNVNGASMVAGLYSKARVSQSIGEVREFPLTPVIKLLPEGIEDYIQTLDEAKFVTFRRYIGLEGFYVTNARMFAPDGSDYQYAETVRTMNKAVKEVRKAALIEIQSQIDPTDVEGSVKAFKEFVQLPIERMVDDKDLISGEVIIPEGQDVLGTSKLQVKVSAVPMPIMREIEIEFALTNPFN